MTAAPPGHPGRRRLTRHTLAAAVALTVAALAEHVWAAGRTHQVAMKDVAFAPAQTTVHVGDTVVWDNADIVAHTATSEEGGFDVSVPPGSEGRAVLTRPGRFGYICRYHPNMKGQIVAEP